MPVAMPTWRKVELMPDAMPACRAGTTPTAVEASGGLIESDADSADDEARHQVGPVGLGVQPPHEQQPDADDDAAGADEQAYGHPGSRASYSFVYGNVGVIALDANDVSYEIPANFGITGGKQTAVAGPHARRAPCQPRDIDFIVVFFHHCAFSTTNSHASDGGVQAAWVPLFEKHQVDLVINGHNHVYERTDAIQGQQGVARRSRSASPPTRPRDGIVYVTAGRRRPHAVQLPGAGHVRGQRGPRWTRVNTFHSAKGGAKVTDTVEWSRVRYTDYSFVSVEVEAGRQAASRR